MVDDVEILFRQLAELSPSERKTYFERNPVAPDVRAEVESLLSFDSDPSKVFGKVIVGEARDLLKSGGPVMPERRCGPYRLTTLLGRGGMGSVYLAQRADGEVEQKVAIKLLRYSGEETSFRERFLRERQILANLSHPGIARLLDAGHTAGGRPYLAMEYVDGTPIDVYARGLDLRGKLSLYLEVCDAVAYAHRNLVIHRDLKPSNILVDQAGRSKLLDFGIAKILDASHDETQTREVVLTPNFASPEQVRGGRQAVTSDIYSLGAVLYLLLTGKSPHDLSSDHDVERAICFREPEPASRINPSLPKDLDFIVAKALRKEPDERYPYVEALADDIRAVLEWRPVRARSGNTWYRVRKFLRRRWLPVAAAGVALAGVSAGFYAAERERALAQRRFVQVRQLAGKWIALDREVRGLRNSAKAREQIVATIAEYLSGVGPEAHKDRDLALETAAAYLQVGRVQGVPTESNIGHFADAEQSLRKADALTDYLLARSPRDRQALQISADVAYSRLVLAGFQDRYRDAVTYADEVETRLDVLRTSSPLSPENQGNYDDAIRRRQQATYLAGRAETETFVVPPQPAHSPPGLAVSWGYNDYGQLGNDAPDGSRLPARVAGLDKIVAVASGRFHSIALRPDGTVWAWGKNSNGQLGNGSQTTGYRPVQVRNLRQIVAVACGFEHSLALASGGALWVWGGNFTGQLGIGNKVEQILPVRVPGIDHVIAAAGGGAHSLALRSDGSVWAWGYNSDGQLGNDGPDSTLPARVSGINHVVAIAAGGAHSLALKSDGTVWAWGFNALGQTGNGSNVNGFTPLRVAGLSKVVAISAGDVYSLALKADGTVWGWGVNNKGELGNGSTTATSVPVLTAGLHDVVAISAAAASKVGHNLALKSDGTVWEWGFDHGARLGPKGADVSLAPVPVPGIREAVAVSGGGAHNVVLLRH